MAKGMNDQQKRALLTVGVVAMIIVIGLIVMQTTRPKEAKVEIPKEEIPSQGLPGGEQAREVGAVSALDYLANTTYWSGEVGASINGTIVLADAQNGIVIFEAENGTLYYTRITDMTDTFIGEATATLDDFKPGMPITVSYEPYYIDTEVPA